MKRASCLLTIFAACASPTPIESVESAPAPRAVELVYAGECSLTAATVDEWIAAGIAKPFDPTLSERLEAHAREHGWSLSPGGVDFADDRTRLECPESALAHMVAPREWPGNWPGSDICGHMAIAWERMGRLDRALEWIGAGKQWIDRTEDDPLGGAGFDLFLHGYMLSHRNGEFEKALVFATEYKPAALCGDGRRGRESFRTSLRARALIRLGRAREAIVSFRSIPYGWSPVDLAAWVDALLAAGAAPTVAAAARQVADDCGGTPDKEYMVEEALALRELRAADRATRLARLHDFSVVDEDGALELALSLDDEELLARAAAFDVVDNDLRDPMIAMTLARTGAGVLEPHVLRASAALGEEVDSLLEDWRAANARRAPVEARRRQAAGR